MKGRRPLAPVLPPGHAYAIELPRLKFAGPTTYGIAFGPRAGQKVLTVQGAMPRDADFKQSLCADIDGFSSHAHAQTTPSMDRRSDFCAA